MSSIEYKDNNQKIGDNMLELSRSLSIKEDEINNVVKKISILEKENEKDEISKSKMIMKSNRMTSVIDLFMVSSLVTLDIFALMKFNNHLSSLLLGLSKPIGFIIFTVVISAFTLGGCVLGGNISGKIKKRLCKRVLNSPKYEKISNEIDKNDEEINSLKNSKSKLEKEKVDLILEISKCNLSKKVREIARTAGYTIAPVVHQETSDLDSEDVKKRVRTIDNK